MTLVVGNYLSPYVRKVLVCLTMKGVPYTIDPITPFFGNDAFAAVSPLRRIPVLIDDELTLCDSTVICEYLDERYPGPALLPTNRADRAQARWLEEFADSRMGDVIIWRLFNQLVTRIHAQPAFEQLAQFEQLVLQTPPANQRAALLAAGAPLSETSFGADVPRRGVMPLG
ncbi:glutathione S-transferase family protein [Sandarakinorhabdus oryzae]|uniref:glutathione S-transferase family protein n=1 Tax=Sandarakinorhabdus oryzae TaxID=2675220 RepID=UPI0012E0FFB8|nr:glutathione S-transferase family protein [Sandarakinorhabdus oryzae]